MIKYANSPEVAYAYDILFTFARISYAEKKVLSDNEMDRIVAVGEECF